MEFEKALIENGCRLCPKKCGVDRVVAPGSCGQLEAPKVARAALHFWEEPPLSGFEDVTGKVPGSGTVFFSGCPLTCVYCQNRKISSGVAGKTITAERLAQIFLELQAKGALNINLVTPMHFAPAVYDALQRAQGRGLTIPVVANVGGYDSVETIEALSPMIDIWLVDAKYFSETLARELSSAPGYFNLFRENLKAMVASTMRKGGLRERADGTLLQGVMVRHLVLPGQVEDSKKVLEELARSRDVFEKEYGVEPPFSLSIMNQYTPPADALQDPAGDSQAAAVALRAPAGDSQATGNPSAAAPLRKIFERYPDLLRSLSSSEYEEVLDYAAKLGFEEVWSQEEGTVSESFIPAFDLEGVEDVEDVEDAEGVVGEAEDSPSKKVEDAQSG